MPTAGLDTFTCADEVKGTITTTASAYQGMNEVGQLVDGVMVEGKGSMYYGVCAAHAPYVKGKNFKCIALPGHRALAGWNFTERDDRVKFLTFVTVGPTGPNGGVNRLGSQCREF